MPCFCCFERLPPREVTWFPLIDEVMLMESIDDADGENMMDVGLVVVVLSVSRLPCVVVKKLLGLFRIHVRRGARSCTPNST